MRINEREWWRGRELWVINIEEYRNGSDEGVKQGMFIVMKEVLNYGWCWSEGDPKRKKEVVFDEVMEKVWMEELR